MLLLLIYYTYVLKIVLEFAEHLFINHTVYCVVPLEFKAQYKSLYNWNKLKVPYTIKLSVIENDSIIKYI